MANCEIIVNEKNMDRIGAAISEAEGRAESRCVDAESVTSSIARIEEHLNIPKKWMEGLVFDCDPNAQAFPNAYKYTPYSTQFTLTYAKGKWRISNIRRDCTRTAGRKFEARALPQTAIDAIVKKVRTF